MRWYKMRTEENEEEKDPVQTSPHKNPYDPVVNRSPPGKPGRPGDILLPSMDAFPSGKDVMKLHTEEKNNV